MAQAASPVTIAHAFNAFDLAAEDEGGLISGARDAQDRSRKAACLFEQLFGVRALQRVADHDAAVEGDGRDFESAQVRLPGD